MNPEEIKRVVELFNETRNPEVIAGRTFEQLVEFAFMADGKLPHTHMAGIQDIDECRICGLSIYNRIHI